MTAGLLVPMVMLILVASACTANHSAGGSFRYVGATPHGHIIPIARRRLAGNATAPYLDSARKFSVDSMHGQVIVLNYWAAWCGSCVSETPGLERTYMATKTRGVTVIGIAVKDEAGHVASFVRDHHLTYPIVFDEVAKTALQLGDVPTYSLPSTVVIDRAGRIAAVYSGIVQQGDLQPVVTALAREKQ